MSAYPFQEPSAAWKTADRKPRVEPFTPLVRPGTDTPFLRALDKLAAFAVNEGMTLFEAEDHLRTAMVKAGMRKYPIGQRYCVAPALGIHRNTVSRIRKGKKKCA